MELAMWLVLALAVVIWLGVLLQRSRERAEVGLSPEQIRRKRMLEGMTDNLRS